MTDFGIEKNFEIIKTESKNSFNKIVKVLMLEYSLAYLLNKKETHSNMYNLKYTEIKQENYLKLKKIYVIQAKTCLDSE